LIIANIELMIWKEMGDKICHIDIFYLFEASYLTPYALMPAD